AFGSEGRARTTAEPGPDPADAEAAHAASPLPRTPSAHDPTATKTTRHVLVMMSPPPLENPPSWIHPLLSIPPILTRRGAVEVPGLVSIALWIGASSADA